MDYKRIDNTNDTIIFATLGSAVIEGRQLKLTVACPPGDQAWSGIIVGYTYKVEEDKEDYYIEASSVKKTGVGTSLVCNIDLEEFPFKPTNWNIRAVYEEDGLTYAARIQNPTRRLEPDDLLKGGYSYVDKTGHIVFTCTTRGGYLGLRYREKTQYDSKEIKSREVKAFKLFESQKDQYKKKNIILIYEKRCSKAQDNAYYLFKYCMENGMEKILNRSIYYIIEKDSPDMEKLMPYRDHVLIFGSLEHMTYMLAARLLISSDAKAHGYIWQYDRSIVGQKMNTKRYVFLGHGVLAIKRLNDTFLASRQKALLTTVTSDAEADIVVNELGYKKSAAVVTGYARFDGLKDTSSEHREILIMPTHRSWVFGVDRETFVSSEYYKRYMELINSPELIRMLKENDLTANFYLHPSIAEHFDAFTSSDSRVKLVPMGSVSLDDLMMRCKMLVTDYSSVCWDLYYMGKPIVFYQYDVPEYLETWGSYIDLEKDTPGNRADNLADLLAYIEESIKLDFKLSDYWESQRESHYKYIDRDNCKRICQVMKERNL